MSRVFFISLLSLFVCSCSFYKSERDNPPSQAHSQDKRIKTYKDKAAAEAHIAKKGWQPHRIKDGSKPVKQPDEHKKKG